MEGVDHIADRKMAAFDAGLYRKAVQDYRARLAWSDRILYKMCEGPPRHANLERVHGKLSLLGRSYATGLERLLYTDDKQSGNLVAWADYFVSHAKTLDGIVRQVRRVKAPLSRSKLEKMAVLHGQFAGVMQKHPRFRKTKKRKGKLTPTSFVAKYLHFHNPVVPIYDSWAVAGARRLADLRTCPDPLDRKAPRGVDEDFWKFLRHFWCVYRDARRALRRQPSVRRLDRYFLLVEQRHGGQEGRS